MPITEGLGTPQQTFNQWNDPNGTKLVAINRDGTIYCGGVNLAAGTGITFSDGTQITATAVPIISQRVQALNTTVVQSLALSLTTTQMVQVSIYASAAGTAAAGHEVVMTLNYTCELGAETIVVNLPLDTRTIVMETYPLLCLAGTTITLSTAYAGGATNDPYNLDARLVEMP